MRLGPLSWTQLFRKVSAKDGRGQVRTGGKTTVIVEAREKLAWRWALAMSVFIGLLHFVLFTPLVRIDTDFPNEGEIANREIRAPFSFRAPYLDRDVEMRQLQKVLIEPPALRNLGDQPVRDARSRLEVWNEKLRYQLTHTDVPIAERISDLSLYFPSIDEEHIRRALTTTDLERVQTILTTVLEEIFDGGVADLLPPGNYSRVWIVSDDMELQRDVDQVTRQAKLDSRLMELLLEHGLIPADAIWAASVLRHIITPNLIYNSAETKERQELARNSVTTEREFIKDERIVDQGVRVTEQDARYLTRLHELLVARGSTAQDGGHLTRVLTRVLLIGVALGLYGWLGWIHFPVVFHRLRLLVALASILAVFLGGAAFALNQTNLGTYGVPIALLALLTTVLFHDRVGYATTILAVSMLAILPESNTAAVFFWLVLGLVTVLSVRRIQKRSQFYQTIALLTLLSLFLITILTVAGASGLSGMGRQYLVGLFTPIISVAFALFLLPVIEPAVGVSSDLTLLELSDLNHPLLQRMALEAQGTYHHSQVVSQLAEHAARAIGANALLTRVGALFHDIGKMQKSVYFVENQSGGVNKHDDLSPSMSALVVADHVKNGIELAKKWRLPQAVIDFIPQHHGTSVMEFFYHKALESGESVKVDDYRYPGPKPQNRETAILMLADAVEAATRSLAKPTPARIKEVTKQIIDKRLLSGELDESNLTISDLAKIRAAFIPLLTGIHHARIAYPGQRVKENERNGERIAEG